MEIDPNLAPQLRTTGERFAEEAQAEFKNLDFEHKMQIKLIFRQSNNLFSLDWTVAKPICASWGGYCSKDRA